MDGDLPLQNHNSDSEQRKTARLLETLTERPDLGSHTRDVVFMMATECVDTNILKIFDLLPRITTFRLMALKGVPSWNDLSAESRQALVTVSRIPTLRVLGVTGFRRLPLILLHANPLLKELTATDLRGILPSFEVQGNDEVEGSFQDFPSDRFKSLRHLDYFYSPPLENHQWMVAAIKASSESGSLQSLSLTITQAIASLHLEGER